MQQGLGVTGQGGELPSTEQQFARGPRFLQGETLEGLFATPALNRREGHDRQPGPRATMRITPSKPSARMRICMRDPVCSACSSRYTANALLAFRPT